MSLMARVEWVLLCDNATTWCERIEVEALGDDLLIRLGGVPVMQEGIYRFDVGMPAGRSCHAAKGSAERSDRSPPTRVTGPALERTAYR